jgi:hypothetical protein
MALHPLFNQILASHGAPCADTYRGWVIRFDYPPIPCRDFDWSATPADYDGEGDSRHVTARTRDELLVEIDRWHDENEVSA